MAILKSDPEVRTGKDLGYGPFHLNRVVCQVSLPSELLHVTRRAGRHRGRLSQDVPCSPKALLVAPGPQHWCELSPGHCPSAGSSITRQRLRRSHATIRAATSTSNPTAATNVGVTGPIHICLFILPVRKSTALPFGDVLVEFTVKLIGTQV